VPLAAATVCSFHVELPAACHQEYTFPFASAAVIITPLPVQMISGDSNGSPLLGAAATLSSRQVLPPRSTGHRLRWSTWRRRHQHRARTSHYQRHTRP
jgi:hypothetical protein